MSFFGVVQNVKEKKKLKVWQDAEVLPVHCSINKEGREKSGLKDLAIGKPADKRIILFIHSFWLQ